MQVYEIFIKEHNYNYSCIFNLGRSFFVNQLKVFKQRISKKVAGASALHIY